VPIAFNCTCGKTLRVPDSSAGRRAKCPVCSAVVEVPAPEPEFEIVEDEEPTVAAPGAKPYKKPAEEEEYDGTYQLAKPERTRKKNESDSDDDSGEDPRTGKGRLPNFRKGRDKHT
jgi:hypothetical protein